MRIFLQHGTSGMFLAPTETWVAEESAAMQFEHVMAALDYSVQHQVNHAQILIRLNDPRRSWQLVVPFVPDTTPAAKENQLPWAKLILCF